MTVPIDRQGRDPVRIRRALARTKESVEQVTADVAGKADKVSGATAGNFAGLDGTGNLTDSGSKAADFAAASHAHAAGDITSGTLADGRVAESNVTQHQAAIDHDELTNFEAAEHVPVLSGAIGSIPSAGTAGRLFVATDELLLYRDNGVSWDQIGGTECGTPILDETGEPIADEDGNWLYSESCD